MIVLDTEKLIILTPNGVGSTALHVELCNRANNFWILGDNETGGIDSYVTRIPTRWKSYDRAVMVRNPYTRVAAMHSAYNDKRLAKNLEPITLGHYVDKIPLMRTPIISKWAENVAPYHVIHYESIAKDIRKITGLRIRCATEQRANWRKDFERLTPQRLSYLYEYLIGDLVRYGYISTSITPIEAAALRGEH
jgi:hypothetical protein